MLLFSQIYISLINKELIKKAKTEKKAFGEVYELLYPGVFRYFSNRFQNRFEAEDMTSEAFFKILENIQKFKYKGENSFEAWVFAICRNLWYGKHRKRKVETSPFSSFESEDLEFQAEYELPRDNKSIDADSENLLSEIVKDISNLKPPKDEILRMYFFDKVSQAEIAKTFKKKENAIKVMIHREVARIREKFRFKYLNIFENM